MLCVSTLIYSQFCGLAARAAYGYLQKRAKTILTLELYKNVFLFLLSLIYKDTKRLIVFLLVYKILFCTCLFFFKFFLLKKINIENNNVNNNNNGTNNCYYLNNFNNYHKKLWPQLTDVGGIDVGERNHINIFFSISTTTTFQLFGKGNL